MKKRGLTLFRARGVWTALVVFGLLMVGLAKAEIIPANRRITWQGNVGIPGGITNRSTIWCNVQTSIPGTALTAKGDGSTDDTTALQYALDHCPAEQVIYIPAGTYRVTAPLVLKGSYTVRGAGTNTIISGFGSGNSGIIGFGTFNDTSVGGVYLANGVPTAAVNISGATRGATSITVPNTTGLTNGMLMCIDELNNTNFVDTRCCCGNDLSLNGCGSRVSTNRLAGQVVVITNISGTTVSFDPPLFWDFTNSAQEVTVPCYLKYAGIENLRAYANNSGYNCNFSMVGVAYCWLKNVEGDYADGNQVTVKTSTRCEIRDSYFHDGYLHTAGSTDDCLLLAGHSTGVLVENNIFRRLHISVMVEHGGGGDVIAYNFSTNNFDQVGNNTVFSDFDYHGAHPVMVLWEGNFGSKFNQDGGWASASHGTVFRCFLTGENWACPPWTGRGAEQTNSYIHQYNSVIALNLEFNSSYFNVVGSLLGDDHINPNYLNGVSGSSYPGHYQCAWPTDAEAGYSDSSCYQLGYSDGAGYDSTVALNTLLRHGNWDAVTRTQAWDGTIADHSIPNSLYLASKPLWFGNLAWPPVNPATGDSNSPALALPAMYRYLMGTNPPAGMQPPVANASGIPTNGPAPMAVSFSSAGSYDPGGANLTYSWTFGDGATSTAANPSHTYTNAGTYTAQLSVSDGTNTSSSPPISIRVTVAGSNQPPIAVSSASPTAGVAPLGVTFSSAGSYDPEGATLTYNWMFGDGSTSTLANPSHTYSVGTFSASLQVSDGTNTTAGSPITITVTSPPPTVVLSSPADGSTFVGPTNITLSATVTANGHTVTSVSFFNGTNLLAQDNTPPYTFVWSNANPGTYSLSAQAIYDSGASISSAPVVVTVSGLVAAYGFEEGSGTTSSDTSGNGNTASISGATWTTGRYGTALAFNGTNSLVTISDSPSLDFKTNFTLEVWVYLAGVGSDWESIIFKPVDSSSLSYVLQAVSQPSLLPSLGLSVSSTNLMGTLQIPLNTWTHVAATYDGASARLFINGTQVSSQAQTGTLTSSSQALTIGGNSLFGAYFNGKIDEVRVYNRALNSTEIQHDMTTPVSARPPSPTGLHIVGG